MIDIRKYDTLATLTYVSLTLNTLRAENFKVGMNWAKSAISPDGLYVASGSADGTLFTWNTLSHALEPTLKEHAYFFPD